MTEYDYSPEAHERYLATQHRISHWVMTTEYHRDQFEHSVPVTPPGKPSRKDPLYHHPIYSVSDSDSDSSHSSAFSYVFLHNSAQVPAPSPPVIPQQTTSWYRPKQHQPWGYPAQALLTPTPYPSPPHLDHPHSSTRPTHIHRPRSTSPPKPRLSVRTASHNDQRFTPSLQRDANSYFQTVHHPQYNYQYYQQPMLAPAAPNAYYHPDGTHLARTRTVHRGTRR